MDIKELKFVGFERIYGGDFKYECEIEGYYFISNGKIIEWQEIDEWDQRKPLHIKDIDRFKLLIYSLTGEELSDLNHIVKKHYRAKKLNRILNE